MKFRKMADGHREKANINTALVLSGGGAKGAYQIGVIGELLCSGITFDLIIGSSIGAFNGTLVAEFINNGLSSSEIRKELNYVWSNIKGFLPLDWPGILRYICCPWQIRSIFSNHNIKKVISSYLDPERYFNHYSICQLSIVSTNFDKREVEIFDYNSSVKVKDAVLASTAYPIGLPAVVIDNNNYVDGGLLNNAPLKEAVLWGAREIYIVFLTPLKIIEKGRSKKGENQPLSAWQILNQLPELIGNKLMYGDLVRAEEINRLLSLISNYHKRLPAQFLNSLIELFELKKEYDRRVLKVIKIAPKNELEPPGTAGFNKTKVLKKLILLGKRDARDILKQL
ncbi:MAG: patatin-like phospholipase family protein [Halanaerobiales bacterium]